MFPTAAVAAVTLAAVLVMLRSFRWRIRLSEEEMRPWPPLPTRGFITGRVASRADTERGDAVFFYEGGSRPLIMPLPQYALFFPQRGRPLRAVVVQAEMVEDQAQLLGLRLENGEDVVAWRWQVRLLGHTRPGGHG